MTSLEDILHSMNDEDTEPKPITGDEKLRAENPGLQELWEQYQTMLKLIKPAKEPRTDSKANDMLAQIRSRQQPNFKPRKLTTTERLDALEKLVKGLDKS